MQVKINGEIKIVDGNSALNLQALLESLGVDAATVVAEVDGNIIERARFMDTQIRSGQDIELIRFVGGG